MEYIFDCISVMSAYTRQQFDAEEREVKTQAKDLITWIVKEVRQESFKRQLLEIDWDVCPLLKQRTLSSFSTNPVNPASWVKEFEFLMAQSLTKNSLLDKKDRIIGLPTFANDLFKINTKNGDIKLKQIESLNMVLNIHTLAYLLARWYGSIGSSQLVHLFRSLMYFDVEDASRVCAFAKHMLTQKSRDVIESYPSVHIFKAHLSPRDPSVKDLKTLQKFIQNNAFLPKEGIKLLRNAGFDEKLLRTNSDYLDDVKDEARRLIDFFLDNDMSREVLVIFWQFYPYLSDWCHQLDRRDCKVENPLAWTERFTALVDMFIKKPMLWSPNFAKMIASVYNTDARGEITTMKERHDTADLTINMLTLGFAMAVYMNKDPAAADVQLFRYLMYFGYEEANGFASFAYSLKQPWSDMTEYGYPFVHIIDVDAFINPIKTKMKEVRHFVRHYGFLPFQAILPLADARFSYRKLNDNPDYVAFLSTHDEMHGLNPKVASLKRTLDADAIEKEPSLKKPKMSVLPKTDVDEPLEEDFPQNWISDPIRNVDHQTFYLALFLVLVFPMSIVALTYGAQNLQHKQHDCQLHGHLVRTSVAAWLVVLGSVGIFASVLAIVEFCMTRTQQRLSVTLISLVRWNAVLGLLFLLSWTVTGAVLYAENVMKRCRNTDTGKVAISAIVVHGTASAISLIWVISKTMCLKLRK